MCNPNFNAYIEKKNKFPASIEVRDYKLPLITLLNILLSIFKLLSDVSADDFFILRRIKLPQTASVPSVTKNEIPPSILLQINWKDSKFWINPRDSTRLRPLPLKTDDRLNVMFWRPRGNSRLVLPPIVPSM